ncbi:hypothetical protein FK268_12860 [Tsukamurella sputi]|uniref:Uncharacterized protein n=1 Tax=Tsukamurella sputi TaxID=2591848 RepID=A0A5C5RKU3_9ACTN|nr:hypothetical protein [Tsukamurella sputi]TWS23204.1 hypothetical protein FK268_12860 [Tsukamurella sputi]
MSLRTSDFERVARLRPELGLVRLPGDDYYSRNPDGYVYALSLADGGVKFGRTQSPHKRLLALRTLGEPREAWVSRAHVGWIQSEARILREVRTLLTPAPQRGELWDHLTFDDAVALCRAVVSGREPRFPFASVPLIQAANARLFADRDAA